MRLRSAWNSYWFAPGSYFDLAVLRIIAVGTQVFYMLNEQFSDLTYVYTLPQIAYAPLPVLRGFLWPFGVAGIPAAHSVFLIYGLCLLCGFAALFGLLTNFTLTLFAIGCLFLQAFVFSFHQYHHPEAILLLALLALALGPCGKVLSLDSLWHRWRAGPGAARVPLLRYSGEFAGWPVRFVQWVFPLIYLSAAIAKVAYNHYTLDWANGFTLQYYFIQDNIRKDLPLAMWASQFHWPILLGQFVVLAYQCTYWMVVPWPRLRWVYLPLGLSFHLANYLILYAPFPQWIALLSAYIPWAAAARWLARSEVTVSPPPRTDAGAGVRL
jgi:hypothetical protein